MPVRIITADERLSKPPKVNIALFGPSGIGKTYQCRTLDPATTLFVDLEAGDLALGDWRGDKIDVRAMANELTVHPWELARALACVMSGPDMSEPPEAPYSLQSYNAYVAVFGEDFVRGLAKYRTVFWDSITVASRHSFAWSKTQPEATTDKGKFDLRGVYGKHGNESVRWLTTIQHIQDKSTVVVGILDEEVDEMRRVIYSPQIEGGKTGRELPGIFDEVLTLSRFQTKPEKQGEEPVEYRALVCHMMNPWGYPAKDRSGCLDMLEPPDLGALIKKIQAGARKDTQMVTAIPQQQAA